ncbi:MAG: VWA domain-containing protein [Chthoniobacterales bacterium]|nr:VWA domain-containing protein [Chthoniobacterales bacterium]
MSFGAPEWLWGLLVLPILLLLFLRAESRSAKRLRHFVAPRLLAQLGATVNHFRRRLRFALLLLGIGLALVSLAKPRWGYTFEEVKRKGLDLLLAVDTSRSMLANDVPPNRLQRVKLAAQDLIQELRGDRIGLIAFAGRAFVQAPLTIDYDAAVEALTEIDTNTIPEGGTNISEAITLAVKTFGKSALGNRALIVFTDGEELAGDSLKIAQQAADSGVRIFTIGVGTPEGSLIPVPAQGGGTAFVKDRDGQVVKSKLDEKRLREIAESTGGIYLPLGNGPSAMQQLYRNGLSKLQAGDIDTRTSRQPIERYQWPLAGAILVLGASLLISERKRASSSVAAVSDRRTRATLRNRGHRPPLPAAALILLLFTPTFTRAAAPGLEEYRAERFREAYEQFQQTLKEHPETRAQNKIQFDAGAAAYKMKDYGKALESFSQALLSPDTYLQSRSHYNLGNTLYQRGEAQKSDEQKLKEWTNALQHYDQTLKIEPENKEAKENAEFVKNKIEELKKKQQQPSPTPSPSPSPQEKKDQQKQDQNQEKDNKQQQDKSGKGDDQKPQNGQDQSEKKEQSEGKDQQEQPGQSPSPSPTPEEQQKQQSGSPSPSPTQSPDGKAGSSPSPSPGQQEEASPSPAEQGPSPSPSPGEGNESASPTPSPGEGEGNGGANGSPTPAATPASTPAKKPTGDVKGTSEDQPPEDAENGVEVEPTEEGQMSEQQAERLLRSMRDEEARVQLDEHRAVRRVYKDW